MKTGLFIALPLLIACVLSSCQQEPNFPPPPVAQNDSVNIKTFVRLHTGKPAGIDTIYKLRFQYDSLNRISFIEEYDYDSGGRATPQFMMMMQVHYSGSLERPYRTTSVLSDDQNGLLHTNSVYLTYDNNGRPLSRGSRHSLQGMPPDSSYTQFQYGPNQVTVFSNYNILTMPGSYDTLKLGYQLANGNIVNLKNNSPMSLFGIDDTALVAYDNKPNPFRKLGAIEPYISCKDVQSFNDWIINVFAVNNITSYTTIFAQTNPYGYSSQSYIYNAAGYPVSATVLTKWTNTNTRNERWVYEY